MGFLQPLFLLAMPLMAIPVVIHLLNQRRHQTMPWAATRFLLQAMNVHRGRTVLRRWTVLAMRMLAIGALIVGVSRPLISQTADLGIFGQNRTQIIVLDRSPSMGVKDSSSGLTWSQTVLAKLQHHLMTTGHQGTAWVCQSLSENPSELQISDLLTSPHTSITATSSDIPTLIERALDFVETNDQKSCDIWVCTDRKANDWNLESGRWARIQDRFKQNSQARFHVLLPEKTEQLNLAVSTSHVSQIREEGKSLVKLDFKITQTSGQDHERTLPVLIRVAGIERKVDIQMVGKEFHSRQMKIEIPDETLSGCGLIEIPEDANAFDNQFNFSFAVEPIRRSVVVTDDEKLGELLQLLLETPVEEQYEYKCEIVPVARVGEVDWNKLATLIWHAPIPNGVTGSQLERYVADGGNVLFLPVSGSTSSNEIFNARWGEWQEAPDNSSDFKVGSWRTEDDLLATDDSGRSIPIGQITCKGRCSLDVRSASTLANFDDGQPLLTRLSPEVGNVYFLATIPDDEHSSFIDDGIALFVMLHRAMEQGVSALSLDQTLEAGANKQLDSSSWKSLLGNSHEFYANYRVFNPGTYSDGDRMIAVNRPLSEDMAEQIAQSDLDSLFQNANSSVIATSMSTNSALSQETWKLFVVLVVVLLIAEGWISLPQDSREKHYNVFRWVSTRREVAA